MSLYKKIRVTSYQRKARVKKHAGGLKIAAGAVRKRKAKRIRITSDTISMKKSSSKTKILVPRKKKKIPSEELRAIEEARNLGYKLGQAGYGRK